MTHSPLRCIYVFSSSWRIFWLMPFILLIRYNVSDVFTPEPDRRWYCQVPPQPVWQQGILDPSRLTPVSSILMSSLTSVVQNPGTSTHNHDPHTVSQIQSCVLNTMGSSNLSVPCCRGLHQSPDVHQSPDSLPRMTIHLSYFHIKQQKGDVHLWKNNDGFEMCISNALVLKLLPGFVVYMNLPSGFGDVVILINIAPSMTSCSSPMWEEPPHTLVSFGIWVKVPSSFLTNQRSSLKKRSTALVLFPKPYTIR